MKSRRALSLVEVVLTIVILGLAIPPLLFQITASVQLQEAALVQQNLTALASERMWEIVADHANPTRGYTYVQDSAYPAETDPGGLTGYSRTTTVREVDPADYITPQTDSGIKRFKIMVTGIGSRTLVIESFVAELPGTGG